MEEGEVLFKLVEALGIYKHNLQYFAPSNELQFVNNCMVNWRLSRAQGFQDLFVALCAGETRDKFFVEFGATDGVNINNTYLLEKSFGWKGILAEPARCWHEALKQNRECAIDTRCVWTETGATLTFNQTPNADHSTISTYGDHDYLSEGRVGGELYPVETVSLLDLLIQHQAPRDIEYLSIDTEGSELDILTAFDFDRFNIKTITVEHNFTPEREAIFDLLTGQGYRRVFEVFSRWDDWYVKL